MKCRRTGEGRPNRRVRDPVIEAAVNELRERSAVGQRKYRAGLDRTDWTRLDRLTHALHEACDLVGYLTAEVIAEEKRRARRRS